MNASEIIASIALLVSLLSLRSSDNARRKDQQREKQEKRPLINWEDRHIPGGLMTQYGLYIKNSGHSTAINLTISQEYMSRYPFLSQWSTINRDLPPGEETLCARGPKRFLIDVKDFVISYQDPTGEVYSTVLKDGQISFK